MSFESPHIKALRDEESRLLDKFKARQQKLMALNPRLTPASAYAQAVTELPKTYAAYQAVRLELAQFRQRPQIRPEMGLSDGK